jgi:DNA-binding response OmpR family regulator
VNQQQAARILLVDGNADLRTLLAHLLRLEGFLVDVACNRTETLAQTDLHHPDLIILACHLWCDDPDFLLTALKAETPETAVLVFTEDDGTTAIEDVACLNKFAPVNELLAKVRELTL